MDSALLAAFEHDGIVRLSGVFDARAATRMQDVVWNELRHRHGIERDDPTTWDRHLPSGLKSTKKSRDFAPVLEGGVRDALDTLLGAGWQVPKHYGQVLVTMPNAREWRVPHRIWHSDFPSTLPAYRLVVVKLWILFDDVEPGGGGTPQLLGSHRAFAAWLATTAERDYKRTKHGFLASHPWLRLLTHDRGEPDRNERLLRGTCVDGVDLRVVECCGRAGDVFVTHPWVFHSIAPNASSRPRLMRSLAIAGSTESSPTDPPAPVELVT